MRRAEPANRMHAGAFFEIDDLECAITEGANEQSFAREVDRKMVDATLHAREGDCLREPKRRTSLSR